MAGEANKTIGKLLKSARKQKNELKIVAKDVAKKKLAELKIKVEDKIPTEEEIKTRFMEELTTRGPEVACTPQAQRLAKKSYDNFKKITSAVMPQAESAQLFINKVIEKSAIIEVGLVLVEGFLDVFENIVDILTKVLKVITKALIALISSDLIPVPIPVPGKFSIFEAISRGLKTCNDIVSLLKNLPKVISKYIRKIRKIVSKITKYIYSILGKISVLVEFIKFIIQVVESAYLFYINLCNVSSPEDNAEDLNYNEDLENYIQNGTNDLYNQTIKDLQNLGKEEVIQKIYDANFVMVGYRRYKSKNQPKGTNSSTGPKGTNPSTGGSSSY